MKERHTIAVKTLVDLVLRTGDLKATFDLPGRPLEGIRAHQRIQRQRPDGYRAEVAVVAEVETPELILVIGGRIDGVLETPDETVVEEIKSTRRDLDTLAQTPDACHWGQALVYACLLAREKKLPAVSVQLTYVHLDSAETVQHRDVQARDQLEAFFTDLVQRYLKWASLLADWHTLRDESIARLVFPFAAYRAGQRDMAVAVYRAMRDSGQAIIQAATGIGKTMAALFPAVKALGEAHIQRIFFLTARNTGKAAANAALNRLQDAGMRLKRVVLTAKEKICFCPQSTCDPEQCEFAKGHFDRLNSAMEAAFLHDRLDRAAIETAAREHRVCPFELSLELALWADCLVCDYNYAFDPRVYLRRFFDEENGRYGFLVDEAHNLVDRARDMFSANLEKSAFLELRRAVKTTLPTVYRAAGKINHWLGQAKRRTVEIGGFEAASRLPDGLEPLLRTFLKTAETWLARNEPAPYREILLDQYFSVNGFLRIWELFDDGYVTTRQAESHEYRIKLFCMDPSAQLRHALKRCRAAVFFSATMTPAGYFQSIFGCDQTATRFAIPSPFPAQHFEVLIAGSVPTTYTRRLASAGAVADMIETFVRSRTGNYLCFFPSYSYLEMVTAQLDLADDDTAVIVQQREMDAVGRNRFLAHFSADIEHTLVGFAVMGGIFAEGIDLVGERLCGAVVVGVGLPTICPERELIRDHFAGQGDGFDFAYRFPGINRVLQAAGRVIRTDSDRGALLLIDRRFRTPDYRGLLPAHWSPTVVHNRVQLSQKLSRFWIGPVDRA